jgi:transglutaminase-like putative cysteine protease
VRAFYDYIGDELVYTYNGENWGAQAALGPMGADCTEYASLLVALSRAQKIPARYFEGLLVLGDDTRKLAQQEHAWADVFLPGVGWVSMDPTWDGHL